MKKIDVNKSLIFSRNIEDLKNSLGYLYQDGYCSNSEDFSLYEEGNLDGVHASNFMETNMKIDVEKSIIYRFDDTTDLSEAVLLLGEKGYFSDDKDFSDYITGTLTRVVCWLEKTEYTFVGKNEKSSNAYRYFIPKHKVVFKEEPKKKTLRPFKSIDEFFEVTGFRIGDVVKIKRFGNLAYVETSVLNGFRIYTDDEFHRVDVIFGSGSRTFDELFKCYKYLKNGKWLWFGVEE